MARANRRIHSLKTHSANSLFWRQILSLLCCNEFLGLRNRYGIGVEKMIKSLSLKKTSWRFNYFMFKKLVRKVGCWAVC